MFDKISRKVGLTKTEIRVILFLTFLFLIGLTIKFFNDSGLPEYQNFDYSKEDSLFNYYINHYPGQDSTSNIAIDSKHEVLEFNSTDYKEKESPPLLKEKSIDINTANEILLERLPGIGPATAKKILELRSERGKFNRLEELLDVKGIGESKFKKIEKFLYIK